MEIPSLVIIALMIVLFSVWFSRKRSLKNALPGPRGLPIVGYIPFLTSKPYIKLTELAKTYGPVYSVRLGSRDMVVICDFSLMKEAFASDSFFGRPPDLPFNLSETTIRTGAMFGLQWKEQRRFCLHMLRDVGFGRTKMEEHIKDEILEMLDRLSDVTKRPVKISDLLAPSMSNNIASVLFGRRLKYDDPRRQRLDYVIGEVGKLLSVGWQQFFPWIEKLSRKFDMGNRGKLRRYLVEVGDYCREELKKHEETLDPNNIRDFMDGYLLEIEKKSKDTNSAFQKDVLTDLSISFFGAGSDTVRIAVDWVLLICAAYPEVQKQIHQEIDSVLGQDSFPSGQDRLRMPFTEAAILETMRWHTLIPLNLLRYTLEDTELNGYFIPKHTHVVAVLWSMDHDESLWGKDVHEYKPQRFLSEDGQKVVKPEHFTPFSIGKRSCPGKSVAEIEIFLYVTAILQKFKVSLPAGKQADFEGILGIGLQPKRQELILEPRNK